MHRTVATFLPIQARLCLTGLAAKHNMLLQLRLASAFKNASQRSNYTSCLMPQYKPVALLSSAEAGGAGAGAEPRTDLPPELLALLDSQALDRLRELDPGGKMGLVTRVLRTFDSSMIKLLQQLEEAQVSNDHQVVRHVAHTLKSSAASVGALQLSAMCADIERRVRESDTAELPARLDAMVAECQRLRTGLKSIASA